MMLSLADFQALSSFDSDTTYRFYTKIRFTEDCWVWTASIRYPKQGYGGFSYKGKIHSAHVIAFRMRNGRLPEGGSVRHTCDNPPCVNWDHLLEGTHQQNMQDMIKRGRNNPSRGVANGRSVLTESDVVIIRNLRAKGYTGAVVADMFGVTEALVSKIYSRKMWTHVQ